MDEIAPEVRSSNYFFGPQSTLPYWAALSPEGVMSPEPLVLSSLKISMTKEQLCCLFSDASFRAPLIWFQKTEFRPTTLLGFCRPSSTCDDLGAGRVVHALLDALGLVTPRRLLLRGPTLPMKGRSAFEILTSRGFPLALSGFCFQIPALLLLVASRFVPTEPNDSNWLPQLQGFDLNGGP